MDSVNFLEGLPPKVIVILYGLFIVYPGSTSLPGGLIVCTLLPGGVVGPVNASAFARTFLGISALQ
jgi:hypothetical protein